MDNQPSAPPPSGPKPGAQPPPRYAAFTVIFGFIALFLAGLFYFGGESMARTEVPYGKFMEQLEKGNVAEAEVDGSYLRGKWKDPDKQPADSERYFVTVLPHLDDRDLDKLLREQV